MSFLGPIQRCLLTATIIFVSASLPQQAHALDLDIGARIGGNWSILARPTDPVGEPTVLHGSAFSGFGFTIGPTASIDVYRFDGAARLFVSADLLYSYHSGSGYAEHSGSGQKRTVFYSTNTARVPVLVHLAGHRRETGLRLGIGPELIVGFSSKSEVVEENVPGQPEAFHTVPKSYVAGTFLLAFDYYQKSFSIPVEARFTWNPFVGKSTKDRFEDYEDMNNPGSYQAVFSWQILFMTGISWSL